MPVHVQYRIIGKNVSECRRAMNLTQEQLAERAGICQQFLSRIETGRGIPSVATVMALCDALDVESNMLLTRSAATPDLEAPSRLRSDGSVFTESLSDELLHKDQEVLIVIQLDDLPKFDLEIPDTIDE